MRGNQGVVIAETGFKSKRRCGGQYMVRPCLLAVLLLLPVPRILLRPAGRM
jgi:hypothetical protein